MKLAFAAILAGAFAAATLDASALQSAAQPTPTPQAQDTAKDAAIPPPIAVDVVAVDPKTRTITVREIRAVPAPPGKPVEVRLAVPATATGQKLADTKAGEQVAISCEVKPTVHPAAGVPIVITDCARVIKIEPKS